MTINSVLLDKLNVNYGFGTKYNPVPDIFKNRKKDFVKNKQIHGVEILEVTSRGQNCGECDALLCKKPLIPIHTVSADCVTILISKKDSSVIISVHAGWRGTLNRISRKIWDHPILKKESPSDFLACIGPSISSDFYEVSKDLEKEFSTSLSNYVNSLTIPKSRHLDLKEFNRHELLSMGLKNVEILPHCTFSYKKDSKPLFNSYRREGKKNVQYSIIEILPKN